MRPCASVSGGLAIERRERKKEAECIGNCACKANRGIIMFARDRVSNRLQWTLIFDLEAKICLHSAFCCVASCHLLYTIALSPLVVGECIHRPLSNHLSFDRVLPAMNAILTPRRSRGFVYIPQELRKVQVYRFAKYCV